MSIRPKGTTGTALAGRGGFVRSRRTATAVATAVAIVAGTAGAASASAGSKITTANVTIGIATPVAAFEVPNLAAQQGYFDANGVHASVEVISPGVLVPAIASGSVPLAVFAAPQIEEVHLTNPNVVWLGVWEQNANITMIAAPGVTKISGLAGKTVGVTTPGSEASVLMQTALEGAKLSSGQVNEVQLGSSSAELAAFDSGQISAFLASQPLEAEALANRPGSKVIDQFNRNWIGAGIAANLTWVKHNKAATLGVLKGLNLALKQWKGSPTVTQATISEASALTNQAQLLTTYNATNKYFQPELQAPTQATEQDILSSLHVNGFPAANPKNWKSFFNASYLADIAPKKK